MAINSYKQSENRKGISFFGRLNRLLKIEDSLENVIHLKYLPQIIFLSVLSIFYIANRHSAEKKIRTIGKLEVEVEDLRADYTTLKASYMFVSKQSEVAKRAERIGLSENESSPILISKE